LALRLQVPVPPPNLPTAFWDVSGWVVTSPPSSATVLRLQLPANYYATNPASNTSLSMTPVPGVYSLVVVNRNTSATSVPLPFGIAPVVTPPTGVTFPAALSIGAGGIYTIQGGGFAQNTSTAVQTQVVLDTVPLTFVASGPPAAGQFTIDPTGTQIQFSPPSNLPPSPIPGEKAPYFVRVRVNGVEAPTNWFITVPPS
jgi:hypothetical protein